jgi:hypothetical protein
MSHATRDEPARQCDFRTCADHVIGEEENDGIFALKNALDEREFEFAPTGENEEQRLANRKSCSVEAWEVPTERRACNDVDCGVLARVGDAEFREAWIDDREIGITRGVFDRAKRKARRKCSECTGGEKRGEDCGSS